MIGHLYCMEKKQDSASTIAATSRESYGCLPNYGRCGQSQDRVSINCPLVEQLYPAEWMAAQLITPLEIDGIGQFWEDSNTSPTIVA